MPIVPVFGPSTSPVSGGGDMELIFSTTLTSTQTTISTGTLATGYRDLVIRGRARGDFAFKSVLILMSLNGDSTDANYSYVRDFSTATQASFESNNLGFERGVALAAGANAAANAFGVFTCTIFGHESTTNDKTYNSVYGNAADATTLVTNRITGRRASTEAITAIAFSLISGDFIAGTSIAVYGVK